MASTAAPTDGAVLTNGTTPHQEPQTNGTTTTSVNGNGNSNGRRTPSISGLALTEYTVNSTSPPRAPSTKPLVPEDYLLPNGHPDYVRLINTSRVYDVCERTPLTPAIMLSRRLDCNVLLKREDMQPVFSFKLRGAYNKMAHLPPEQSWKGVIACSAGNHAQGVAYSARKLKIPATIVMPEGTPSIKHANVSRLGGTVVLHGPDFDTAKAECQRLERSHGLINIPPFDDPYVIAGQGTIASELLGQTNLNKTEAIFCCVGGGGLIAGIGVYVRRMYPHVKIIGVEQDDANAMAQSLAKGERVVLKDVGFFADGAAVKTVGEETFRVCQDVVDEIVQVSKDETCAAIKDVFEDTRSIVEPAGALAVAGLKKWVGQHPSSDVGRSLVAVLSGANMNFDRLRFVGERATLGEGKEVLLSVRIPERPGAFAELIDCIMPHNVTEFSYRHSRDDVADVLVGISLLAPASQRATELQRLTDRIGADGSGMTVTDLSGNELAKSHIRYLVGGRSAVADERVYMFTFPERPGALQKFLLTLRTDYNISLFQYRNSGGDVGEIVAGIQCPEVHELEKFLKQIGYPYKDCTDDPVFKTFLRAD
ncbi:threonine dehydratase I [Apiospora kogelbergensis]|uniref:threonine dehydratase I n=1 Tax=Apiospora kogelbergensis TaxID=1337665 RepID=UPI00312ED5C8